MRKILLLAILSLIFISKSNANHMIGGRIYYQWLYGTTYKISVEKYYECNFTPLGVISFCMVDSTDLIAYSNYQLFADSVFDVSLTCDTIINKCQNATSIYPGWQGTRYSFIHDFGNNNHWQFGTTECCFPDLDNLLTGLTTETVYFTTLYLNNVPYNNSPYTPIAPVVICGVNQPQQLDLSAFDPDGDSLVYELEQAYEQSCVSLLETDYAPGFSYLQPITTSGGVILNSQTGILSFTPTAIQKDLIVYKITEYRNGVVCGYTHRSFQLHVMADPNTGPNVSGINGTSDYSLTICAGDSVNFNVVSSDPGLDSTRLTHHTFSGIGGIITSLPGLNQGVNFSWQTDSSTASPIHYGLNLSFQDNNCPFNGITSKAYSIQVNSCPNNTVWPGDANTDKLVDAADLLPIGISYGSSGPIRNNASLTWISQPAQGWTQFLSSGVDYKHSDCDGNGVVDSFDILGITQNMGQSHLRMSTNKMYNLNMNAELQITTSKDTIAPGETITCTINLGDNSNQFTGYGFSFDFNSDPAQLTLSNGIFLQSTFLGNNLLKINQVLNDRINSAATRYDHINTTGHGSVYSFEVTANPSINSLTTTNLNFNSSSYSDISGSINSLLSNSVSIVIDPFVGISENTNFPTFNAYINNNNIQIHCLNYTHPVTFELKDLLGRLIRTFNLTANQQSFDLNKISEGLYFLHMKTNIRNNSVKLYIPELY